MSNKGSLILPSEAFPFKPAPCVRVDTTRGQAEIVARAHLEKLGIKGPVRFEFAPVETPQPPAGTENPDGPWIFPIQRPDEDGKQRSKSSHRKSQRSKRSSRTASRRKRGKCKVEKLPNGVFTCSHPNWVSGTDCWHIKETKAQLGVSSGPYSLARRRPETRFLFPSGPSEEMRRRNARIEAEERVPEMFAELCVRHIPVPKRRGRTGLTTRGAAYALGIKCFSRCSYEALLTVLPKDVWFTSVAPNWLDAVPTLQTLCRRFGAKDLSPFIEQMIAATARPGRKLDRTILIDSDNIPTTPSANSRNEKFGGDAPPWRAIAAMIKRHFGVGDVTGLIGVVAVTLNVGLGSGDGPHMPSILEKARAIFEAAKKAAGDKAYSLRRNFAEAERLGFELYVLEKGNERRLTARKAWPEAARRMTRMQRNNPRRFNEVYRMRSKVEGIPSSLKRRYPFLRLRARKSDPIPQFPTGLSFDKDADFDEAISKLDDLTIAAIMAAAQTAVGCARLNETLMTILLENLRRLVTLEHLFDQRVDFGNPDFAFEGIRLVSESDDAVDIKVPEERRPLDNLRDID